MSKPTTLYRFYNTEGELLYVGITLKPSSRFYQHKREKPWHEVARITLEHLPNRTSALKAEAEAIRTEKPRWNVVGNNTKARPPSPTAMMHRLWPDAAWIDGSGNWASVAHCRVTTVLLFPTHNAAMHAKELIDRLGCGGFCHDDHEIWHVTNRRAYRTDGPKRRPLDDEKEAS